MYKKNDWIAAAGAALLATITLTGCGGAEGDAKAAAPSTPAATSTPAAEPTANPSQALEDAEAELDRVIESLDGAMGETLGVQPGTYEITENTPDYEDMTKALDDEYLAPGTYKTKGPSGAAGCYWARMSDATGSDDSIIANDYITGSGLVELKEGDFFKTTGCKPWVAQVN
ncbi:hypothetical protein [Streptomyces sp. NPDC059909]|uniref:hypothetical protein n=1 Tax=Streptomyces sp. NPDC059909 TaxID=3346998 RepID=UPI00365100EA